MGPIQLELYLVWVEVRRSVDAEKQLCLTAHLPNSSISSPHATHASSSRRSSGSISSSSRSGIRSSSRVAVAGVAEAWWLWW